MKLSFFSGLCFIFDQWNDQLIAVAIRNWTQKAAPPLHNGPSRRGAMSENGMDRPCSRPEPLRE